MKPMLSVLKGNLSKRIPVWYMRQAGRYLPEYRELRREAGDFLNLCYSPDLAVKASLQPLNRFDLDAVILFSDILVVPHALGRNVNYIEGEGPILNALQDIRSLPIYEKATFLEKLSPVFETIKGIVINAPRTRTIIGFSGAPWTLATYMVEGGSSRDFAKTKAWAINDPATFQTLIDLLVDSTSDYLSAQLDAGADALQIFDSWAGVLSETELVNWSLKPIMKIIKRVRKAHPDVHIIVFPRGVGVAYIDYAKQDEITCVSLDSTVPLDWAQKMLQPKSVIQGNLDPMFLINGEEKMFEATETKFVHDWRP